MQFITHLRTQYGKLKLNISTSISIYIWFYEIRKLFKNILLKSLFFLKKNKKYNFKYYFKRSKKKYN